MKSGKKKSGGVKNNPRLKLRTDQNDISDNDESKQTFNDYQFVVNCLCDPNIVLRPQEILEYIAITIKTYVGTHLNLNMHQKTFIINSKNGNKYSLKSIQKNNKDENIQTPIQLPVNVKELHDFTRIGLIVPIIYQKPPKSLDEDEEKKQDGNINYYTNTSRDVIAILQERKTRLSSNNFRKGILFPYILNNERYEWQILNDLYITTIQKNYKWQRELIVNERANDAKRSHFESTLLSYSYGKTRNVIKSIILCNKSNTNMKLCVFTTTSGLFYTEPRLIYNYQDKNNRNYQMNISIPLIYRKAYTYEEEEIFVDFWTQGNNEIYIWNNNTNIISSICFNINSVNKYEDINMSSDNKNNEEEEEEEDKQEEDADTLNEKLQKYNLLTVNEMYKVDTKKSIFAQSVKPQKDHCEIRAVYYENGIGEYVEAVYWVERSKFGNWRCGGISKDNVFKTSKQKSIKSKLRAKEKNFYQTAPKELINETFYIAFVDDRDVSRKQVVIILKKHVVIIPLLKKSDVDNEHNTKPFAYCLNVKDVAPKLLLMNNEIKFDGINQWHYNYSNHTLFIFERLGATGVYPYRMNEIAINAFKFV